jgi:hypothetical protein
MIDLVDKYDVQVHTKVINGDQLAHTSATLTRHANGSPGSVFRSSR